MATEPRARLGAEARRDHARRHRRVLLHQRRRRGERERHQARAPVHGPPEDPGPLPLLPRRHRPGHRADRRPAPLGRRDRASPASSASPTSTAGAARTRSRSSESLPRPRGRHHVRGPADDRGASSSRPSSAPTASSSRPTATCRACARSATATASCSIADEVMAGFGRTGGWFAVDHWGVVPDLITMAKGLTASYLPLGAVGMRHAHRRRTSRTTCSTAA